MVFTESQLELNLLYQMMIVIKNEEPLIRICYKAAQYKKLILTSRLYST